MPLRLRKESELVGTVEWDLHDPQKAPMPTIKAIFDGLVQALSIGDLSSLSRAILFARYALAIHGQAREELHIILDRSTLEDLSNWVLVPDSRSVERGSLLGS